MPIQYARRLAGRKRTPQANRHLGLMLAFVAGAINAGGFLAVQQYTSHMTGIVSSMADNLVLGAYDLVLGGAGGLLCFIMGLQNAVITKLSQSEIRTTHNTGIVTDIGIELGKLVYWNRSPLPEARRVRVNRPRLVLLSLLALSFFLGGLSGAYGFKQFGYLATLPLAALLVLLASGPALDDLILSWRRLRRH